MSTPRAYHHGDLRAVLLATTECVLVEGGIGALSLREISRRAGVSPAAAYKHFRDKQALLRVYVDAAFEAFAKELQAARDSAASPLDALIAIGVAYVGFATERPASFRVMFRPECTGPPPGNGEPAGRAYAVLVDGMVAAREAGEIVKGPLDAQVLAAWCAVHGLATLLLDGPLPELGPGRRIEVLTRSTLEVLIRGLAPKRRSARAASAG